MTVLKIYSAKLDPAVNYNSPVQTFVLQETAEEQSLFIIETLKEEVTKGTLQQQLKKTKKLKKILKGFMTTVGVGMQIAPRAFAAGTTAAASNPITPALVMKWGLTLALVSVSVGVALAMIMLTVAGMYRMFRKRDLATEWSTDVIKGLVQVLIAVPTVYLLFYLAQIVFKNLPILSSLF